MPHPPSHSLLENECSLFSYTDMPTTIFYLINWQCCGSFLFYFLFVCFDFQICKCFSTFLDLWKKQASRYIWGTSHLWESKSISSVYQNNIWVEMHLHWIPFIYHSSHETIHILNFSTAFCNQKGILKATYKENAILAHSFRDTRPRGLIWWWLSCWRV